MSKGGHHQSARFQRVTKPSGSAERDAATASDISAIASLPGNACCQLYSKRTRLAPAGFVKRSGTTSLRWQASSRLGFHLCRHWTQRNLWQTSSSKRAGSRYLAAGGWDGRNSPHQRKAKNRKLASPRRSSHGFGANWSGSSGVAGRRGEDFCSLRRISGRTGVPLLDICTKTLYRGW